ncbi:MAG: serine O-acetyltransferase [Alphaproteobacteria bacterium]|nr:serine O-acetyltransferase [Alphaproteobacteria bacterium]
MFARLNEDIRAVTARDPAVRSRLEVVLFYPGFHALLFYRLAHAAWRRHWFLLGRGLSHLGRLMTGIEIHPAATIGRRFFIDHGMGVVIGETSEIGDDVTLYHDVTLGGISPAENSMAQANTKRHPTLGDSVIVGSGAQILGPIRVGDGARIGANSVVLRDVAPGAVVVGIPAKPVTRRREAGEARFEAYAATPGEVHDPVARAIEGLLDKVQSLSMRVGELEAQLRAREGQGWPSAELVEPPPPTDEPGAPTKN